MFMIFNKDKIASYTIILGTVIMLFGIAFSIKDDRTVLTSSNITSKIDYINVIEGD